MQLRKTNLIFIFLVVAIGLRAQTKEINRLIEGELQMTFPSIYFKNNSTDYAVMPYTTDSCFKYIATHLIDITSFTIWRDSNETEGLTNSRIKKLKTDLNKYTPTGKINIQSMGKAQKISRQTIKMAVDSAKTNYLLSLNSVFDVSNTLACNGKKSIFRRRTHLEGRYFCFGCWKRGAFSKNYQRLHGRNSKVPPPH